MRNWNREYILIEMACVLAAIVLGAYWAYNSTAHVEPYVVVLLAVPVAMEILRRVSSQRTKKNDISARNRIVDSELKVLLVEDDKFLAEDVRFIFQDGGVELLVANSLSEAMSTYKENRDNIDVVICDVMMGGTRDIDLVPYIKANKDAPGLAFAKWIRTDDPTKVILGCSAVSTAANAAKWFDKRAGGFFHKPLDISDLIEKIRQLRSHRI